MPHEEPSSPLVHTGQPVSRNRRSKRDGLIGTKIGAAWDPSLLRNLTNVFQLPGKRNFSMSTRSVAALDISNARPSERIWQDVSVSVATAVGVDR
jgi:hypothetical protein